LGTLFYFVYYLAFFPAFGVIENRLMFVKTN